MKVILKENIEKLGFKDEIVDVKNGFARNFLIPKNKKNLKKAIDALKKVELYDYVKKLDKGLDHILLSNGKELSGGQKQKLIIARAIYFKKEIFIFDEATNSLDKKTENNIINLLKSMTPERTIILISHDLEVINKTDFIIKLNKRSANFKK